MSNEKIFESSSHSPPPLRRKNNDKVSKFRLLNHFIFVCETIFEEELTEK